MALLYDTSHYTPKYPGGTDPAKWEYNDTGAVDYSALNWMMDETGAGENYRYRICNDKLGVDLKRDPYILLDDGQKLVYRDEVFIKQM